MAETKTCKKIVIQSLGTRGDAQPMAAVALSLMAEGYDVTVLTNLDSVAFVESLGVKAVGVFYDFQEESSQGMMAKAQLDGDFQTQVKALEIVNKKHAAWMVKAWFEAMTELKPDLCISGTLVDLLGMVALRHFNIPTVTIGLQPIPAAPSKMIFGLPNLRCSCLNRCVVNMVSKQMVLGEMETYGVELKKQYGIDCSKLMTNQEVGDSRVVPPAVRPIMIGADPIISNVMYDGAENVPKTVKLLGFFAINAETQVGVAKEGEIKKQKSNQFGQQAELDEIEAFCSAGKPPVYLGFGSMVAKSPEHMVVMLSQAVKLAGARGIICKGWANLSLPLLEKATKDAALVEFAKTNIMFVGNTPHPWLFPKCSCIVHHGGAGTTSTASRALVPQIIVPVWCDQWDMAHFLNVYGSGVGFYTQLTQASAQQVADAINKAETDKKMQAKAKEWGELALLQRGTKGFVEELKVWWDEQVVTGNVAKHSAAAVKAVKG